MKNLFIVSLLILTSISCNKKEESSQLESSTFKYVDISVSEFNSEFNHPDSNTVILDVRTDQEYEAGNIPNSVQIDFLSSDFKSEVSKLDPSKTYVVYCRTGGRSSAASKIMVSELGFTDVKNLDGGYTSWHKENQ